MLTRFGLYDFIAAVIPGLLFIWAILLFSDALNLSFKIPLTGELAETSILIALSYIVGILMQGISQGITEKLLLYFWKGFPSARWLFAGDTYFSDEYKSRIKKIVEGKYGINIGGNLSYEKQLKNNQEIFYLCYNAVVKENLNERPQIFNTHYGLSRCLLTSFSILFIICLFILFLGNPGNKASILYLSIFFLIGTIVSYFRTKKRGEDFARSVYDLFLAHYGEDKQEV